MSTISGISDWRDLDDFAKGFLESLFFIRESDRPSDEWSGSDEDGDIPSDLTFDQVHPDSIRAIAQFCSDWQKANVELLDEAQDYYHQDLNALGGFLLTGFTSRGMDADGDDLGRRLDAANKVTPDDFLLEWDGEWVRVVSGIPVQLR